MGLGRAAAALRQHITNSQAWDTRVSDTQFERSLNTCLNQYAALHMTESDPTTAGLPPEGLLSCCHVCRQGHKEYLVQQGVVVDLPNIPLLHSAVDGSAGRDAVSAADSAVHAAVSAGCMGSDDTSDAAATAVPLHRSNVPDPANDNRFNAATGLARDTVSFNEDVPQGAHVRDDHNIRGLGGSFLPARSRPAEWYASLDKLNSKPLQVFKPYSGALIIHSIYFDGLRRVAHFAKAGKCNGKS